MTQELTKPMVWSDKVNGRLDVCAVCGRPLGKTRKQIEVVNGGRSVALAGSNPDENDPGYMGWFSIGPDCAKKYFAGGFFVDGD